MINFEHVTNSGGATRVPGDERRAAAGKVGDAVDTRRLDGLGEGHRWQRGGSVVCNGGGTLRETITLYHYITENLPTSDSIGSRVVSGQKQKLRNSSKAGWP